MKTKAEERYHVFEEDNWETKLEGRFWNCQGKHIAIIASVTKGIDWTAHVGTDAPDSYEEDDTLKYVARKGCKLSEQDARYFFPEIELPYRH